MRGFAGIFLTAQQLVKYFAYVLKTKEFAGSRSGTGYPRIFSGKKSG
jgi:hypothetical protein